MAEGDTSDAPEVSLLDVILDTPLVERARESAESAAKGMALRTEWGADPVQRRAPILVISGPSGSGKSSLARALASHLGVSLAWITGTSIIRGDVELSQFLSEAQTTQALAVIEESEALFSTGGRESPRAMDLHEGLVVLLTDEPSSLNPEVAGGAIEHIRCRFPNPEQRQAIWEVHLPPDVPLGDDLDISVLGHRFPMSGKEISDAVRRAIHLAVARQPADPQIDQGLLVEVCEAWARDGFPDSLREPGDPGELAEVISRREQLEDDAGLDAGLIGRRAFLVLVDGPAASQVARTLIAESGHRPMCLNLAPDAPSMNRQLEDAVGRRAVILVEDAELLFPSQDPTLDTQVSRRERRRGMELLAALATSNVTALFTTYAFGAVGENLTRRISWRHAIAEPSLETRAATWSALWPTKGAALSPEDRQGLAARWELSEEQISHVIRRACFQANGEALSLELIEQACEQEYRTAGKVTRRTSQESAPDPPTT
ncbi:MAG: AAA family ATPase [Myxococcota bacterium]|nr:AAA family ATPase [Myxococcota bacterium]